jgi:hypothetical protein
MRIRDITGGLKKSYYLALYESANDPETRPAYHLIVPKPSWSINHGPLFNQAVPVQVYFDHPPSEKNQTSKGVIIKTEFASKGVIIKTEFGIIVSPQDLKRKVYRYPLLSTTAEKSR